MAGYFQALDTFVVELDGVPHGVNKGQVLPESDPVVAHDVANGGLLFAPLDTGEDKPAAEAAKPAKPAAAKAKGGAS